jgi:hypothetical protein
VRTPALVVFLSLSAPLLAKAATRDAPDIAFTQSAKTVDAYDFVEVVVKAKPPEGVNPFTDVSVRGGFESPGRGNDRVEITRGRGQRGLGSAPLERLNVPRQMDFKSSRRTFLRSLFTSLLPDLGAAGFVEAELEQGMVKNPAEAFTIRVRRI